MNASRISIALAILSLAATARAQSFIPGNQVDDFTDVRQTASLTQTVRAPGHASPIPLNYVDDFGAVDGADGAPTITRTARASIIPSNYVDEFGADAAGATSTQPATADHLASRR